MRNHIIFLTSMMNIVELWVRVDWWMKKSSRNQAKFGMRMFVAIDNGAAIDATTRNRNTA